MKTMKKAIAMLLALVMVLAIAPISAFADETETPDILTTSGSDDLYLGDINGDGKVTATDARLILRIATKLEKAEDYPDAALVADVNGDDKITAVDARIVLRVATRLEAFENAIVVIEPISEVSSTEESTTEAPTTEAPTTEAPTTEAPTTEAPTTEAPTTEAPTTEALTTEAPTTEAPTTEEPTTVDNDKPLTSIEVHDIAIKYTVEVHADLVDGGSLGSGFCISEDGKIVTNYHVIEDATKITVVDYEGNEYAVSKILAYSSDMDIAVLQMDGKLTPAAINYDTPKTGSVVYTLGSSKGLTDTFTDGMVSNNSRVVEDYNPNMTYIQITAPITNGNSGGPTINDKGEVIGINTWGLTEGQNLNFAIPVKYLNELDYSNPIDVGNLPKAISLSANFETIYLKKGGSALVIVDVYGTDSDDIVVSYNKAYTAVKWSQNDYVREKAGNRAYALFITGLQYAAPHNIRVYLNGYKDTYYCDITVSISSDGWYDYGGMVGAVDFGAYTGVAPYFYYLSDDADYCGFVYSLDDMFNARVSPDKMSTYFYNTLVSYGFVEVSNKVEGENYTFVCYNSKYDIYYTIEYDFAGDRILVLVKTKF